MPSATALDKRQRDSAPSNGPFSFSLAPLDICFTPSAELSAINCK